MHNQRAVTPKPTPKVYYQSPRSKSLSNANFAHKENVRKSYSVTPGSRNAMHSSFAAPLNPVNPVYYDYNGYLRTNLDNLVAPEIHNGHQIFIDDEGDEFTTYGTRILIKGESEGFRPATQQFIIEDDMRDLNRQIRTLEEQNDHVKRCFDELTEENYRLRQSSIHQNQQQFSAGEEEEEIIEEIEEEILRQKPQPQVRIVQQVVQQEPPPQPVRNTGIGDIDLNRYHLVDMFSQNIDPNAFPPDYWNRLQSIILKHHLDSLPPKQDFSVQLQVATQNAATMCNQQASVNQKHFGLSVKPASHEIGCGTSEAPKSVREVGCMVEETDERIRAWIQQRIGHLTMVNQEIIQELVYLWRHNREAFLELLGRVLAPPMRSQEVDCTVPTSSKECTISNLEFVSNIGVGDERVSTDYVKRPTVSQSITARPDQVTKATGTDKQKSVDHGSLTEPPLVRSLGTYIRPQLPPTFERAVNTLTPEVKCHTATNTDVIIISNQQQTSPELLSDFIQSSASEQAQAMTKKLQIDYQNRLVSKLQQTDLAPKTNEMGMCTDKSINFTVAKATDTDIALLDSFLEKIIKSREPKRHTTNVQTVKQSTVDAAYSGSSFLPLMDTGAATQHEVMKDQAVDQPDPKTGKLILETWQSETDYGDSTGGMRRTHQTLTGPGGTVVLSRDAPLARKTKTTTMERRLHSEQSSRSILYPDTEYQPVISVGSENRFSPYQQDSGSGRSYILADSGSVERKPSQRYRRGEVNRSEVQIVESGIGIPVTTHQRIRDAPVALVTTPVDIVEIGSPVRVSTPSGTSARTGGRSVRKIPPRNNKYRMSEQFKRNCEQLANFYAEIGSDQQQQQRMTESHRASLMQIISTWFDLTRSSPTEVEVVADFISILYEYSPQLCEAVVKSPDSKNSTALHYAVGHGSWEVVTILLDSGFANVNQLNESGYSALMVATINPATTDDELRVIDQLFRKGDVNMRSLDMERTPLMLASQEGAASIVGLLLTHQANVNAQDRAGNTALMCAVERGHVDVVRRLLMRPELDLSLKDNEGKDALEIARDSRHKRIVEMIEKRLNESSLIPIGGTVSPTLSLGTDSGHVEAHDLSETTAYTINRGPSADLKQQQYKRVIIRRGKSKIVKS